MSYEYEVVNEAVSVKLCVYTTSMVIGVCPQRTGKKNILKKEINLRLRNEMVARISNFQNLTSTCEIC